MKGPFCPYPFTLNRQVFGVGWETLPISRPTSISRVFQAGGECWLLAVVLINSQIIVNFY
ncbi:hypothetical protein FDUTEX481_07399 [Tolypothrix sp. PCC 7601]|nr:hypothetical protein FDUTEX481_07399 [Tolypothrix sp. PCC 7601]